MENTEEKKEMKTFIGKYVKNDALPSGPEYTFNTKEEVKIGVAYLFNEYGHPIYVVDILPEVKESLMFGDKVVQIKEVTLRVLPDDETVKGVE